MPNRTEGEGLSTKLLSDVIVYMKYAKYIPALGRRETWEELVTRNKNMHLKKFPQLAEEIEGAYEYVYQKKVLPSMRALQFGGKPIEISPNRGFNCSFIAADMWETFHEIMFLLLGGSGVGYSVQAHHVAKLPEIMSRSKRTKRFLIGDSIEGWADAVKVLVKSYFFGLSVPQFDFSGIREKGTPLVTSGGKAPGPQPLKDCLHNLDKILSAKEPGEKLTPLEVHDMICHIADAVLSGGIRRAALLALFSMDDEEMLACKTGNWAELNPQRARANNSVLVLRHRITKKSFAALMERIKFSGNGEPGIFFSNDKEWGCNPCAEVSMRSKQFCNLSTMNVSDVKDQAELNARARAAATLGTLQASYTDFHYLSDDWQINAEKEALLGISQTGIASGSIEDLDLEEAAEAAMEQNSAVAKKIGIKQAHRVTCVKPEGTASLVVGSSSGIHAWYAKYYIRRIRVLKNESIYLYLKKKIPRLVEDDYYKPSTQAIISIPVKAPSGAVFRNEAATDLLERIKKYNIEWIRPGHRKGDNTHNVSATVSVKDNEWDQVGRWLWDNRQYYNGITILPYDDSFAKQAPHEEITREQYEEMIKLVKEIDLSEAYEGEDNTNLKEQIACTGSSCQIV